MYACLSLLSYWIYELLLKWTIFILFYKRKIGPLREIKSTSVSHQLLSHFTLTKYPAHLRISSFLNSVKHVSFDWGPRTGYIPFPTRWAPPALAYSREIAQAHRLVARKTTPPPLSLLPPAWLLTSLHRDESQRHHRHFAYKPNRRNLYAGALNIARCTRGKYRVAFSTRALAAPATECDASPRM